MADAPDGYTPLRVRSHRSRAKLYRQASDVVNLVSFREGHVYYVPDDEADVLRRLPSVTRARLPEGVDLFRPLSFDHV